jgi:hypothetical protein
VTEVETVEYLFIEPAKQHRRGFARWCLAQDPRIETASSTGSNVPVDLYPAVPPELLEGAYVDGFPYGRTVATPVAEKPETVADVATPDATPVAEQPLQGRTPRRSRKSREAASQ